MLCCMDQFQLIALSGVFGLCVAVGLFMLLRESQRLIDSERGSTRDVLRRHREDTSPLLLRALGGSLESMELVARLTRENRSLTHDNERLLIQMATLRHSSKEPVTASNGEDAYAAFDELRVVPGSTTRPPALSP